MAEVMQDCVEGSAIPDPEAPMPIGVATGMDLIAGALNDYFAGVASGAQQFASRSLLQTVPPLSEQIAKSFWDSVLDATTDLAAGAVAAPFGAALGAGAAGPLSMATKNAFALAALPLSHGVPGGYEDADRWRRYAIGELLSSQAQDAASRARQVVDVCLQPSMAAELDGPEKALKAGAALRGALGKNALGDARARTKARLSGLWYEMAQNGKRTQAWVPTLVKLPVLSLGLLWAPGRPPVIQTAAMPAGDRGLLTMILGTKLRDSGLDLDIKVHNLGLHWKVRGGEVPDVSADPVALEWLSDEFGETGSQTPAEQTSWQVVQLLDRVECLTEPDLDRVQVDLRE